MASGNNYDANGSEIVCEAVRSKKRFIVWFILYCTFFTICSLGIFLLVIPFLIYAFASNWKLYLTHTEVHYNAGCEHVILPFYEIIHIAVVPGTKNIHIIKRNPSVYVTNKSVTMTNVMKINYVENCHEFVAAVNKEMARHPQ